MAPQRGFFGEQVDPPRLAIASFPVTGWDPDGDCNRIAAMPPIPKDGVVVFLDEMSGWPGLPAAPARPRRFSLHGRLLEHECVGLSYRIAFLDGKRSFQAYIAPGEDRSAKAIGDAVRVLDSLHVDPR